MRKRLSICTDLVADEAVYYAQCHAQFFLNTRSADGNRGRPECPKMSSAEVYGIKRIKQKLQEKYKENIFFAELSGRNKVVCFRNMADWIISDQWYDNKRKNADDDAKRIIETAAKIIKNELKEFLQSNATGSTTCYPSIDDVKIGWIPDHLETIGHESGNESSNAQICDASHVICTSC